MENLFYTVLLFIYLIFSLRIVFKENNKIGVPILVTVLTSWFLFEEKVPNEFNRSILIISLLVTLLIIRYYSIDILKSNKQVNTRF